MKSNYHTHTCRCRHAQGSEEDYVRSALNSNVNILGFSDHGPFPDHDFGFRMPYEELSEYIDTINSLIPKYSEKIKLLKGVEIEYLPKYHNYYEKLLESLDYLLLGQHFYADPANEIRFTTSATSTLNYLDYAKTLKDAMQTGLFKIIAHPDLFMVQPYAWDINCDRAADLIVDTALTTNTILEYNANGFRREKITCPDGERYQYPHNKFWDYVRKSKVAVIVGCDCHNPSQVWDDAMTLAYDNLQSLGIFPLVDIMG